MTNYAVIGNASTSAKAVNGSLMDIVEPGDNFSIIWDGKPSSGLEAVYDFLLDTEPDDSVVTLYYTTEDVPKVFRETEYVQPYKTKSPVQSMFSVDGDEAIDVVLFLWDDSDEDESTALVEQVFDQAPQAVKVLELSNGLAPIIMGEEAVPQENDDEDEKDEEEEEDDTTFTKEELEISTAYVVKRYGKRMGCASTTKSGIIAELFPDGKVSDTEEEEPAKEEPAKEEPAKEEAEAERPVDVGDVYGPEVPDGLYVLDLSDEQELIGLYRAFKQAPNGSAKVAAEEALLVAKFRMRKSLG